MSPTGNGPQGDDAKWGHAANRAGEMASFTALLVQVFCKKLLEVVPIVP